MWDSFSLARRAANSFPFSCSAPPSPSCAQKLPKCPVHTALCSRVRFLPWSTKLPFQKQQPGTLGHLHWRPLSADPSHTPKAIEFGLGRKRGGRKQKLRGTGVVLVDSGVESQAGGDSAYSAFRTRSSGGVNWYSTTACHKALQIHTQLRTWPVNTNGVMLICTSWGSDPLILTELCSFIPTENPLELGRLTPARDLARRLQWSDAKLHQLGIWP